MERNKTKPEVEMKCKSSEKKRKDEEEEEEKKKNHLDQKFFGTENRNEGNSFYFVYEYEKSEVEARPVLTYIANME